MFKILDFVNESKLFYDYFKTDIITLRNFWKQDVDGVASGPIVLHCAAEP